MRWISFLFQLLLILCIWMAIVAAMMVYLYDYYPEVENFIRQELPQTAPAFSWTLTQFQRYSIPNWAGIAVATVIFVAYALGIFLFRRRNEISYRPWPKFLCFVVAGLLAMAVALFITIYFWPEDSIRFGNFFKLQRGPRELFLQQTIHIAILAVAGHLLVFTSLMVYNCLAYRRPRRKRVL